MSNFPALSEMGIKGFDEIAHYSLQQDRKDRDTLKIIYKRKKGSLLPQRKTFKFGRASKMINDDNSPNGSREIFEISPFLQKVVAELDSMVNKHQEGTDKIKLLLKRVDQLEEDVVYASKEIKSILKSIKDK
jgi:hypothetical protein